MAACSRATWRIASRRTGRTWREESSSERRDALRGEQPLQRRHPRSLATASPSRRPARRQRGGRGREPPLRRSRADDAGDRARGPHLRGALHRRLVRDLHRLGRRGRRSRLRPYARRSGGARRRRRAGRAPGRDSTHAHALRDPAALGAGAGARRESETMRLDELTRADFPILQRIVNRHPLVYFDSGASSQKPRSVLEAMNRYYERSHANVHRSIHTLGEEATELYELARDAVQRFIGAPSREEVVFTRGTTDGLGLIAETIGRTLRKGDEIVVTELEHHSNLIPWQLVAKDRGAVLKAVPILADGTLDLAALGGLITPRTRVVTFAHVSNVLGTITPVTEIIRKARAVDALTVVDGAQAAPHLRLDMSALGCDFYVLSAHKMLGPTGIGVMYGRRAVLDRLEPARGGSEMIKEVWIDHAQWNDLPWRFEPGTPPIAEAVGLTAAIEYLEKLGMERVAEHGRELTGQALAELSRIPGVKVYGPPASTDRGAVVAFTVAGLHPHDVAALLDAEGIAVRAGHHCAMPLMRRLGVVGTSRATFSVFNSREEVSLLLASVAGLRSSL